MTVALSPSTPVLVQLENCIDTTTVGELDAFLNQSITNSFYDNGATTLFAPQIVQGTSDRISSSFDCVNSKETLIVIMLGASGDTINTTNKFEFYIQESDDNANFSNIVSTDFDLIQGSNIGPGFTKVTDGSIGNGHIALRTDASSELSAFYTLRYKGRKRYIRVYIDVGGTHTNGTLQGIVALKRTTGYGTPVARIRPITALTPALRTADASSSAAFITFPYDELLAVLAVGPAGDTFSATVRIDFSALQSFDQSTFNQVDFNNVDCASSQFLTAGTQLRVDDNSETGKFYLMRYRGNGNSFRILADMSGTHSNGTVNAALFLIT